MSDTVKIRSLIGGGVDDTTFRVSFAGSEIAEVDEDLAHRMVAEAPERYAIVTEAPSARPASPRSRPAPTTDEGGV